MSPTTRGLKSRVESTDSATDAVLLRENVVQGQSFVQHGKGVYLAAKGLHASVFKHAKVETIDPLRCISLKKLRSRDICRWGVRKLKNSILGHSLGESIVKGYISSGKFPILVEIPKEMIQLVEEHFLGEGKSPEAAAELASSGTWHHVVDGAHIHLALVELIKKFSENFGGFSWPVLIIPWKSETAVRSIALMSNEMQKDAHLIDFTLADVMQNLRDIIDSHSMKTGISVVPGQKVKNGFIKEVMDTYTGSPGYADNTLRNVCGIVLKLSNQVVRAIKELLNEECEDYWKRLGTKRPFGEDTRVYKRLISSQSLKGVKEFLSYKAMLDEDRVNVIYRLRFLARERETFKAFQPSEIGQQCRCILAARVEFEKFDEFLGEEPWPAEMENLRRNLFQTTLLDGELREHTSAGKELLPAFLEAYVKSMGAHGAQKAAMFRRRMNADRVAEATGAASENSNDGESSSTNANNQSGNNEAEEREELVAVSREADGSETVQPVDTEVHLDEAVTESAQEEEEDRNLALENSGVIVHKMSVMEFERNSVDIDGVFDFVIADPFQKVPADDRQDPSGQDELVDNKGVTIYLQCIRRLLVAGGHCFIFLDCSRLQQWAICSSESQFELTCEPFCVIKDASRVQKMTTKGFQSMYDLALVIKKPGRHPEGFTVDRKSPYSHLPGCRLPRWCNVIDGVPPPAQRLTFKPSRAHVRPNERPCALYIEIFQSFCPENGKVLDPSAGALTSGLACVATGRECVLLERDEKCLSFAESRLQEFAKSRMAEKNARSMLVRDDSDREDEDELEIEDGTQKTTNCDGLESGSDISGDEKSDENTSEKATSDQTPMRNNPYDALEPQKEVHEGERSPFSDLTADGSPSEVREVEKDVFNTPQRPTRESPAVANKRCRGTPTPGRQALMESLHVTPTSFRRPKRTRRPARRYERSKEIGERSAQVSAGQ